MTYKYLVSYCGPDLLGSAVMECDPIQSELDFDRLRVAIGKETLLDWRNIIILAFSRLEVEKGD